jgi:hypothetical protein
MAAALSRVYAGICRRDRLISKKCPFWFVSLFCDMVLANQNAKLTGPDQGFLVSPLFLIRKPWERGWLSSAYSEEVSSSPFSGFVRKIC